MRRSVGDQRDEGASSLKGDYGFKENKNRYGNLKYVFKRVFVVYSISAMIDFGVIVPAEFLVAGDLADFDQTEFRARLLAMFPGAQHIQLFVLFSTRPA